MNLYSNFKEGILIRIIKGTSETKDAKKYYSHMTHTINYGNSKKLWDEFYAQGTIN